MGHKYSICDLGINALPVVAKADSPFIVCSFERYIHPYRRTRPFCLEGVKNNVRKNASQELWISENFYLALRVTESDRPRLSVKVDDALQKAHQLYTLDIRNRHLRESAERRGNLVQRV